MNSGILKTLENTNMFWPLKDFIISVEDGETQPDTIYPSARKQIKERSNQKQEGKNKGHVIIGRTNSGVLCTQNISRRFPLT